MVRQTREITAESLQQQIMYLLNGLPTLSGWLRQEQQRQRFMMSMTVRMEEISCATELGDQRSWRGAHMIQQTTIYSIALVYG